MQVSMLKICQSLFQFCSWHYSSVQYIPFFYSFTCIIFIYMYIFLYKWTGVCKNLFKLKEKEFKDMTTKLVHFSSFKLFIQPHHLWDVNHCGSMSQQHWVVWQCQVSNTQSNKFCVKSLYISVFRSAPATNICHLPKKEYLPHIHGVDKYVRHLSALWVCTGWHRYMTSRDHGKHCKKPLI